MKYRVCSQAECRLNKIFPRRADGSFPFRRAAGSALYRALLRVDIDICSGIRQADTVSTVLAVFYGGGTDRALKYGTLTDSKKI